MPERLINLCLVNRFPLRNVEKREDYLYFDLPLAFFFRLRPLVRRSGCRVRIVARLGLPFTWSRIRRRPTLLLTGLTIISFLYLSSFFVWHVEVKGNETLSTESILDQAARAGLRPWVWRPALNRDAIVRDMIIGLPALAWVGINFKGTKAVIEVVEKTLPPDIVSLGPGDLVARREGIIEEVLVLQGEAVVEKGDVVLAGDILIRGQVSAPPPYTTYPVEGQEPPPLQSMPLRARGRVLARTWYEDYMELPLVERVPVPTGRTVSQRRLNIGGREIVISGPRQVPFRAYTEKRRELALPLPLEDKLFVKLIVSHYAEQEMVERRISRTEGRRLLQRRLRAALMEQIPVGARIEGEEAEFIVETGDMVALRMNIEVIEDIAQFRPIEEGNGKREQ